ncbi:uncharacterized protein L3040_002434 [Drepanopeziza brunnea f. sp. 'multigermtubi']|uniref:uncharacterized protein n=1 Tax=Drepanopeziza brunnea f. sp. 'multigermtubi' TaxID=698441 RepID=UPI00238B5C4B|nr:hypothetical protein L3040_002434 [Drepanopeziza brunnea f. sp. 'multigermtubi']
MSLNGLDDPKIKAAHEAAVAEPGGWFLLRYASRDDVELAGRGNGGIVEIRNAIANFEVEEPAPLYGFLRYRRRNVVISYVPEECSRLVQARVTVHLTAVTERFSPHDTEFPITTARELRDTSLSAACSLHTASGSTSSSTSSLRRRRLMEIAEDAEEENRAKRQSTVPEERPSAEKTDALPSPPSPFPELPKAVPEATSFNSMISEAGSYSSPGKGAHDADMGLRFPATERRESPHSTRPDPYYSSSSYGSSGVRPKVKLGPRPSLDAAAVGGRPHTSGSAYLRPVATLPVGIKMVSRGSRKEKERERQPGDPPIMTISPPPMGDAMLAPGHYVSIRPHTSGGRPASRSEPLPSPTVLSSPTSFSAPKTPIIKPEKARLMKALELRNKKKLDAVTPPERSYPCSPHGLASPVSIGDATSTGAPKEADDPLASLDQLVRADDSGISFDGSSAVRTDESDATRSDSYPVSPVGPSEMAESTKASSISESTDETVLEPTDVKEEPRVNEETEMGSHDETTAITNIINGTSLLEAPEEHLEHLSSAVPNPSQEYVQITASDTPEAEVKGTREKQAHPEADPLCEPASQPSEIPETEASGASSNALPILQDEKTEAAPDSDSNEMLSEPSAQDAEGICETSLLSNDAEVVAPEGSPVGSTFSAGSEEISGIQKPRLKGCMEPIRTDMKVASHSRSNSETQFLSDDDFMDELSSAVVQEAQPMSVSKSPVGSPFPSSKKQNSEQGRFSRVFSTPVRKEKTDTSLLEPPSDEQRPPSRSLSAGAASYLNRISQQQSSPLAKKVNLGSGISQRIKALEKLSSLAPGDGAPTTGPAQGASTAFFSVRKANARGKSPTIAERTNSLTLSSPGFSLESSPSPDGSRMDIFTSAVVPSTPPTGSQPESISVTARIVRDPSHPFPAMSEAGKDPSEYAPLDLKQSPLVIDHQRAVAQPPRETHLEPRLPEEERLSSSKVTIANERRSSASIIKDLISEGRTSLSERRRSSNIEHSVSIPSVRSSSRPSSLGTSPTKQRPLSFNSRVSTSSRDHGKSLSPPPTAGSLSSTGTASDEKSDKKSNRASRMMRRMSSSLSASRKTLAHAISPTVREESEPLSLGDAHTLAPSPMSPTGLDIGDVNVQFPDSLLWKRRSMVLDSQGFLIISPALSAHGNGRDKSNAGATRRFHLSEFRPPCIPDVEMQELPNSVVLDFIDGGGLQVACEDRFGQGRILETLEEAHRSWEAYGNE